MVHRKKLIEVALPLEAINVASAREKSIRLGHPSTLHLWWGRRPLAACRAVIFASLVDDPDSPDALPAFVEACKQLPKGANAAVEDTPRMRLFDFIERLVTWEATTDEAILTTARELIMIATEGNPPPLLDPFAGGGSIPLEAQRLGLEAHASDLNPVAVMINKAQIEIPAQFANRPPVNPRDRVEKMNIGWRGAAGLADDVRYYGEWMREKAWERIGHLYPTHNGETVIAWLWARTVKSPNPAVNAHVPLVRSFILSKKKGRERWAKPIIDGQTVRFEVTQGKPPKDGDGTMITRQGGRCVISNEPIPYEYIREEGKAGRMGAMLMAIVTEGGNGRSYYSPTEIQSQTAESAQPEWKPVGYIPEQALSLNARLYGMDEYHKLFTSRQLVALTTFSDLVAEAREQAQQDALAAGLPDDGVPLRDGGRGALAYAEAVSVYLGMNVSKQANRTSNINFWDSQGENVQQVFARQAIPMTWDFTEGNPFSDSSGNFLGQLEYMMRVVESLPAQAIGHAVQQDAAQLHLDAKTLSTDPPYYNNIGYADLSDFFYVWMRKSLRDVYPDIFSTMLVPKAPELIASPYRHGGKDAGNAHFECGMAQTFSNIRRFVLAEYPMTVYYAFKQQDAEADEDDDGYGGNMVHRASTGKSAVSSTGWEAMLKGLINSGFAIVKTWPMHTELKGRLLSIGTNALSSSIVLVCRPRPDDAPTASRRQFIEALRCEMPAALRELQSGNIAPVDLAQASIGAGMAIYSRYSKVVEANGSSMTVRTALRIINQELDTFLAEQEGDIDSDTRFAVDWFQQFGFNEGEVGQADVLARAKNTSVEAMQRAKIVESGRGKVRLLYHKELDPGWEPSEEGRLTVWETVSRLIARLNHCGESGAAALLIQLPGDLAAQARELAYRLYNICERKGWANHAFYYNALVISWPAIQDEANKLRRNAKETLLRK